MGVPGLWDLLRPAAARTSLSALSKEAFHVNKHGLRALTVGIDASIWIFHAQVTHYGENPFLRTIFFKITALLQQPVLPIFVFDGPHKPGQKRNQNVAGHFGTADHRSRQFKALLDVCGLEWWNAPGEAEAELAVMNRQGKIDAVLSDDVDALLFGATCVLRNNSPTLSGAQASTTGSTSARGDQRTYEVYRSSTIRERWAAKEGTTLTSEEDCRMAMTLIALLGGGDYAPEGLPSIGPTISFGLANAGLSQFLKNFNTDRATFDRELPDIHTRIVAELRSNATNQIGRKNPDRANKLEVLEPITVFPDFALDAYLNPCTSPCSDPSQGWPGFGKGERSQRRGMARNEGRGDMEGLAQACEKYFEWGTRDIICKKFASEAVGVFGAEVMSEAREHIRRRHRRSPILSPPSPPLIHQTVGTSQAASSSRITSFFQQSMPTSSPIPLKSSQLSQVAASQEAVPDSGEPPSHVLKIHSVRVDPTNSEMKEYRVAFKHYSYIQRCHEALTGSRLDPADLSDNPRERMGLRELEDFDEVIATQAEGGQKAPKDEIRVWMAEYLVREAWPELVRKWEEKKAAPKKKASANKAQVKEKGKGNKSSALTSGAKGVDKAAFAAFFGSTQVPKAKSRSKSSSKSRSESVREESDEEIETIEHLPPRPRATSVDISMMSPRRSSSPSLPNLVGPEGKKTRARPCPTSSLSSLPDSLDLSPSRCGSPSAAPRAKSRAKTKLKRISPPRRSTISPSPNARGIGEDSLESAPPSKRAVSPKPRPWPFGKRVFSKSKSSPSAFASPGPSKSKSPKPPSRGRRDEPIDICSSSDSDSASIVKSPVKTPTRRRSASKTPVNVSSSPTLLISDNETPIPVSRSRLRKKNNKIVLSSPPSSQVGSLGNSAQVPAAAKVLRESSRSNTLAPSSEDEAFIDQSPRQNRTGAKSTSKSRPATDQQGMLSFPAVAPSSQASQSDTGTNAKSSKSILDEEFPPSRNKAKPHKKKTPSPKKKKKLQYVVVSETSDEEIIDCTRGE